MIIYTLPIWVKLYLAAVVTVDDKNKHSQNVAVALGRRLPEGGRFESLSGVLGQDTEPQVSTLHAMYK